MNKGIIYRLTAPSGHKYIGQTSLTAAARWKQHENDAVEGKDGHCKALVNAIRSYGFENFVKEIIVECDMAEIDFFEREFIRKENTMVPNGYNIKPGGRGKVEISGEEDQAFYAEATRKHNNYNLPPGIAEINLPKRNNGKGEFGFKVIVGEKSHTFISMHETMEQKLEQAMECYAVIKGGGEYQRQNHHKWNKEIINQLGFDLPEGIKYRKDKVGFEVHVKIKDVTYRKTFTNKKKFTTEQNFQNAVNYLNYLKQNFDV